MTQRELPAKRIRLRRTMLATAMLRTVQWCSHSLKQSVLELMVIVSRWISLAFILRAPVLVSVTLCLVVLIPAQTSEHILAYALTATSPARKNHILIALYAFCALVPIYAYELISSHMDSNRTSFVNRRPIVVFIFIFAITAAPVRCLHYVTLAAIDTLRAVAAGLPEEARAGNFAVAKFLHDHVTSHYPFILCEIFFLQMFLATFSNPQFFSPNLLYRARNFLLFRLLPGVAVGLWAATVWNLSIAPQLVQEVGAIFYLITFFSIWLVLFTTATRWANVVPVPIITLFLLAWFGINWLEWNKHNDVAIVGSGPPDLFLSEDARKEAALPPEVSSVQDWISERVREADRLGHHDFHVYVVAAQGGGLYAAYHAAQVLGLLYRNDPLTLRRVFAVSGVSGGSVGASLIQAFIDTEGQQRPAAPESVGALCASHRAQWDDALRSVDGIFRRDFLSEILTQGIYVDTLQEIGLLQLLQKAAQHLPIGFPLVSGDRATSLERTAVREVSAVLPKSVAGLWTAEMEPRVLVGSIGSSWNARANVPALFFNITSSTTGNRVVAGPFFASNAGFVSHDPAMAERLWFFSEVVASQITVIQGAVLSARFPFVTPPGTLRWSKPAQSERRYVDGGYYENSGVATALELIQVLKGGLASMDRARQASTPDSPKLSDRVRIHLVALTHPREVVRDPTGFSEALAPVQAMMQARAARGNQYLAHARQELTDKHIIEFRVAQSGAQPTLGWSLAPSTLAIIKHHTAAEWERNSAAIATNPPLCK